MSVTSSLIAFASQRFPKFSSRVLASSGYTLDLDSFGPDAFSIWNPSTAERQDRAWQGIVSAAKQGDVREDVAGLYGALDSLDGSAASLLEVGCGGGYNSELIAHRYPGIEYHGVDISDAMIALAREHYPNRSFEVGSAYALAAENNSYDVAVDGVALIHMPDWPLAVAEYARTARKSVILHGLTLTDAAPTTTFAKYAYGQPSMELVFNRAELTAICTDNGLALVSVHGGLDYDLKSYIGIESVSETWVLSS